MELMRHKILISLVPRRSVTGAKFSTWWSAPYFVPLCDLVQFKIVLALPLHP